MSVSAAILSPLAEEVANQKFDTFLGAFYTCYNAHNPTLDKALVLLAQELDTEPAEKKDKSETQAVAQELAQALAQSKELEQNVSKALAILHEKLAEEAKVLLEQQMNGVHEPIRATPYIDCAKKHPALLLCCFAYPKIANEGFAWLKLWPQSDNSFTFYPTKEKLNDPVELCACMMNINYLIHQRATGVQRIFFALHPELKNIATLIRYPNLFVLFRDMNVRLTTKEQSQLISSLLEKFVEAAGSPALILHTKRLHVLLREGLSLQIENWYSFIPWKGLNESMAFLFDHIYLDAKGTKELLEYLNSKHPGLIYFHLITGNFFIAKQLMALGLEKPMFDPEKLLLDAILQGLKTSKEVKRYQALILLQKHLKILDKSLEHTLDDISGSTCDETTIAKILAQLKLLVSHYVRNFYKPHSRDELVNINNLMLRFERDYAVAISSLYNLAILSSRTANKCFRGVVIPTSPINKELVKYWGTFGHRPSFYAFFEHGYNHGVRNGVEHGPPMAWVNGSNACCITPSLSSALTYAFIDEANEYSEGYLFAVCHRKGQPYFFGNFDLGSGLGIDLSHPMPQSDVPYELAMPHLAPDTIEGIYRLDAHKTTYDIEEACKRVLSYARVREAFHPQKQEGGACLLKGESVSSGRIYAVEQANVTQFARDLVPLRPRPSYGEYLKTYDPKTMLKNFDIQLGFQDRLQQRRKTVNRALLTGTVAVGIAITYAFLNSRSKSKDASATVAVYGLTMSRR